MAIISYHGAEQGKYQYTEKTRFYMGDRGRWDCRTVAIISYHGADHGVDQYTGKKRFYMGDGDVGIIER